MGLSGDTRRGCTYHPHVCNAREAGRGVFFGKWGLYLPLDVKVVSEDSVAVPNAGQLIGWWPMRRIKCLSANGQSLRRAMIPPPTHTHTHSSNRVGGDTSSGKIPKEVPRKVTRPA